MMTSTPHSFVGTSVFSKKKPVGIGRGLSCGRSRRSSQVILGNDGSVGHPAGAVLCNGRCLGKDKRYKDVDNGCSSRHMHLL